MAGSGAEEFAALNDDEVSQMLSRRRNRPLPLDIAEHLIENVVGYFPIPLGVATNFTIDGRDVLIPMAVEETSIIAAASATAKWIRREGSIRTYSQGNLIIGQVQLPSVRNVDHARRVLHEKRELLMGLANACVPGLVARGGGVRDIAIRELSRSSAMSGEPVLRVGTESGIRTPDRGRSGSGGTMLVPAHPLRSLRRDGR